jgi:hypothetical protein
MHFCEWDYSFRNVCCRSQRIQHKVINGGSLFQMALWLSVSQELVEKRVSSLRTAMLSSHLHVSFILTLEEVSSTRCLFERLLESSNSSLG